MGLSSDGQPIPVVGGIRLTGRSGRHGVGLLNMQTDDFAGRPGDNFTAVRVSHDLSRTAAVAGFYFGREASGSSSFNRVGGFDVRLRPLPTLEFEGFAMRSATAALDGDWAGRGGLRLDSRAHRARVGWLHIGDDFQHDLGFVRRRGVSTVFGRYAHVLRPGEAAGRVREYSVGVDVESTTDAGYRNLLTRVGGLTYEMLFADGGELRAWGRSTVERLNAPFRIGPVLSVQPGEYAFEDAGVEFRSNRSAALSGSLEASAGEFWSGRQRVVGGSLRWRLNAHLAVSTTLTRNVVTLPEGSFTGDLVGLRADWSFTPRMFLNAFIQYNGETDTWLSNVRYNFIHRPLSDLYVVWNETRSPGLTGRALVMKYTHLLAF
jgi:hypothetical protein